MVSRCNGVVDTSMHVTVLPHEAVDALAIKPDGIYVDGTFGRGGHSRMILERLGKSGRLIAFDRDPSALAAGQSGATGHVRLGAGAIVGAKSAVTKDISAGEHVAGVPAVDVAEWREAAVLVRRLPEMRRTLAAMEARLAALESEFKRQA